MTRVVYLLAASHSGSTLLAMLLGRHPELCTVGELKATSLGAPERYRCSCGALIRECQFWQRVSGEMDRRGFRYDVTDAGTDLRAGMSSYVRRLLKPLHRSARVEWLRDAALYASPTWRRRLPEIQARNAALARTLLDLTGAKAVVDSSKIGIRLKYLLRNPDLDVCVVRLIRDGRGVALTYMDPAQFADTSNPELKDGGMGGDRAEQRLTMQQAAREWRRSTEEGDAIVAGLPKGRVLEVRYEDLCANTTATLKKIFQFIGVGSDDIPLDFRSVEHHVVGNGMRFDQTTDVRLDERWRTALTSEDLSTFASVAGPLSRRLGYV